MSKSQRQNLTTIFLLVLMLLPLVITLVIWIADSPRESAYLNTGKTVQSDVIGGWVSQFVREYPANQKFRTELLRLRESGKLSMENEVLINRSVLAVTDRLNMPAAVLWCLMFQESRLNHLVGILEESGARGLGQFSYFGFYEVNHHLTRYTPSNLSAMSEILGKDRRPIEPRAKDILSPSSYYYIPTAVVSTAAYLNNRYVQLERHLDKRKIVFDKDLLWLYAAMAYNKGTRSVLSYWNDVYRRGGRETLEQIVLEKTSFMRAVQEERPYYRSLKKIWDTKTAQNYAKELKIHTQKMRDCSISEHDTELWETLDKTMKRKSNNEWKRF